ncbi:hypothetical protein BJY04DRAFT_176227 [Aspergillus karnatakaensis]|uniref:uncharacterized protein n=1 Tax=Aspergillus karnatakaensis TaxID=1810916 RepID=UPI003CCC9A9F
MVPWTFTATFISETDSGRLAVRIILKAFSTIGSCSALLRICSYASLTLFGSCKIAALMAFVVLLKFCVSR